MVDLEQDLNLPPTGQGKLLSLFVFFIFSRISLIFKSLYVLNQVYLSIQGEDKFGERKVNLYVTKLIFCNLLHYQHRV